MKKKYLVNEKNFLISISEGETFKTEYSTLYVKKQNRDILYRQELIYRLTDDFIEKNKEKLIKLNIIKEVLS